MLYLTYLSDEIFSKLNLLQEGREKGVAGRFGLAEFAYTELFDSSIN